METIVERFWQKTDTTRKEILSPNVNTPCWIWIAQKSRFGYGKLSDSKGKKLFPHRVSWEIHNGPIPAGKFVLHKCDVRLCVRPDHLFLGTKGENMADMREKGRAAKGTENGWSKLTEFQAFQIRSLYSTGKLTFEQIGNAFGIYASQAGNIVRAKVWKHVPTVENQFVRPTLKLKDDQVMEMVTLIKAGATQRSMAKKFGVSQNFITGIVRGRIYKHLKLVPNDHL